MSWCILFCCIKAWSMRGTTGSWSTLSENDCCFPSMCLFLTNWEWWRPCLGSWHSSLSLWSRHDWSHSKLVSSLLWVSILLLICRTPRDGSKSVDIIWRTDICSERSRTVHTDRYILHHYHHCQLQIFHFVDILRHYCLQEQKAVGDIWGMD